MRKFENPELEPLYACIIDKLDRIARYNKLIKMHLSVEAPDKLAVGGYKELKNRAVQKLSVYLSELNLHLEPLREAA